MALLNSNSLDAYVKKYSLYLEFQNLMYNYIQSINALAETAVKDKKIKKR